MVSILEIDDLFISSIKYKILTIDLGKTSRQNLIGISTEIIVNEIKEVEGNHDVVEGNSEL